MAERPTFEGFKRKALKTPEVKAAYDGAAAAYAMKRNMIALRTAASRCRGSLPSLRAPC